MRKLWLLFVAFIFVSCSKENFDVDSISLKRDINVSVDKTGYVSSYKESLLLDALFSNDNIKYSFQIKSPDYDLTWEGEFEDGKASLGITDGATLNSGNYHAIIYGDNGTDKTLELSLSEFDTSFPYINENRELVSNNSVSIIEYDSNLNEIKKSDNKNGGYIVDSYTKSVQINLFDRYQNRVTVSEEL